jgi:indolepyruvate ferredoxin oxidoreductase beta subunit
MTRSGNVLFCGVGGQGILLASEITSSALIMAGLDVKKSEVHGMAQRGGSVVAHLRFGEKVYSPLIEPGSADIEVAFEMLESLRYLPYLNKDSKVIVNSQKILPATVSTGASVYPEDVLDQVRAKVPAVFVVDAFGIAAALRETRAVNMVLVGALSCFLPADEEIFLRVIDERVPEKVRAVNRDAFARGRDVITSQEVSKLP